VRKQNAGDPAGWPRSVAIQRRSVSHKESAIGRDHRAREFQVDLPMKPNLKPRLVFLAAHFPIGAINGRLCRAIYSVRISESVMESWQSASLRSSLTI
jgi:hypothetical protein